MHDVLSTVIVADSTPACATSRIRIVYMHCSYSCFYFSVFHFWVFHHDHYLMGFCLHHQRLAGVSGVLQQLWPNLQFWHCHWQNLSEVHFLHCSQQRLSHLADAGPWWREQPLRHVIRGWPSFEQVCYTWGSRRGPLHLAYQTQAWGGMHSTCVANTGTRRHRKLLHLHPQFLRHRSPSSHR